jgi:hypothetical protein
MPAIPALRKLGQEDPKDSLGYIETLSQKTKEVP